MQSAELHIYTDFLRIVLEILNAILTYALPRNPEVYNLIHSYSCKLLQVIGFLLIIWYIKALSVSIFLLFLL